MSENDLKTFGVVDDNPVIIDAITAKQKSLTDEMRSALLSCSFGDIASTKSAMQYVVTRKIIHQVERLIKFTELMDRLEDKLYDSIDQNLAEMDECDPNTMMLLLKVQSQLQDNMIESHKLLQPYLDFDISIYTQPQTEDTQNSFMANIIPQSARNNIRIGAQALLTELKKHTPDSAEDLVDLDDEVFNGTIANCE